MESMAPWPAIALAVSLLVTGSGCSGARDRVEDVSSPPSLRLFIPGVPFHPQDAYQCGPASLATVLNYWGDNTSPEEIAQAIYLPRLKGTLGIDMWAYAHERNFKAEMHRGSLKDLERLVEARVPAIAFLDLGYPWLPVPHFVVVVGLDTDAGTIIAHDGAAPNTAISYSRFLHAWSKTNYWTLVVRPKPDA